MPVPEPTRVAGARAAAPQDLAVEATVRGAPAQAVRGPPEPLHERRCRELVPRHLVRRQRSRPHSQEARRRSIQLRVLVRWCAGIGAWPRPASCTSPRARSGSETPAGPCGRLAQLSIWTEINSRQRRNRALCSVAFMRTARLSWRRSAPNLQRRWCGTAAEQQRRGRRRCQQRGARGQHPSCISAKHRCGKIR